MDRKIRHIGVTLSRLRKELKIKQEEFAFRCKLDTKTISLLENNQQEPLLSTICSLAKGLEMSTSQLMKEVEEDISRNHT